jgi:uncharacterized repeat protein (TIGR01451 family)
MRILTLLTALSIPAMAVAQTAPQAVSLVSKTQAVKEVVDAKGTKKRSLVDPTTVLPGQPLVFWLTYKNNGKTPATSFVINNPIPKSVDFTAFGEKSDWGLASVDGGKTFAPLATLKVTGTDNKPRAALPSDVTNLRWVFSKPIAAGAGGTISFYGVVE